jgi:hypothetical protein
VTFAYAFISLKRNGHDNYQAQQGEVGENEGDYFLKRNSQRCTQLVICLLAARPKIRVDGSVSISKTRVENIFRGELIEIFRVFF